MGLTNVNAVLPEDVPADISFMTIWSNPPIRVGKSELHNLLSTWLPRLDQATDAWLVVARNLGSDSLQRWIEAEFASVLTVTRVALNKGFRVMRVRKR